MSQPKVLHFAGQARIALQPGMIPLDDDDQRIVNSNWQRIVRNGSQEYDGPLVAIRKAAVVDGVLSITTQETRYSHYAATRVGVLTRPAAATCLAVNLLPIASDGVALLAITNPTSGNSGKLKFFGGSVQPADLSLDVGDPVAVLKREVKEEFPALMSARHRRPHLAQVIVPAHEATLILLFVQRLLAPSAQLLESFSSDLDPDQEIAGVFPVGLGVHGLAAFRRRAMVDALDYVAPALLTHVEAAPADDFQELANYLAERWPS